jgi:preprotein translocase subunit SecE
VATNVAHPGPLARVVTFLRDVRAEMRKVTWPDLQQIRSLSIGVIALSLFIGAVIALMDVILQWVLVVTVPKLFG